jgi:hypothetical protein
LILCFSNKSSKTALILLQRNTSQL